ncbi:uncharacterized protein LOC125537075 isoform X1 [Triticum urartu]|uniref:uncharacterized protein LOC125537075 isoform X1 n=1 Tax=Triticum urartu TaxID=4572 RepID=UPI0020440B7D|nr:uncharacterized protein LOC125537075 isoform X1 [Triticum urartu]
MPHGHGHLPNTYDPNSLQRRRRRPPLLQPPRRPRSPKARCSFPFPSRPGSGDGGGRRRGHGGLASRLRSPTSPISTGLQPPGQGGEPGCVRRRWRPAFAPHKAGRSFAEAMTSPGGESGRRDSRQRRHSVWGCLDLVMLEHGNGKHHLSYGISNSQFTFLPKDFLHCCQYHCSWGLDFVNIKIWVLTSKRVVDLFT